MKRAAMGVMILFITLALSSVGWGQEAKGGDIPMLPPNDLIGWTEIPGGAYMFQAENMHRLVVATKPALLTQKGEVWAAREEKSKFSTDLSIDIKRRLEKLSSVAGVTITYRSIIIDKFLLDDWQEAMPEILKALEALGKAK